ncbi:MAG: hypothetical protein JWM25_1334 [Thermoleophilia bacterium]|nr:hypothetical protein [Thermoleophilia bacterium]
MPPQLDQDMQAKAEQRIDQLLFDAHAAELALVQTLLAHIAMTPASIYRSGLESHLRETRDHAKRIQRHLSGRHHRRGLMQVGYGLATTALGQAIAVGKLPVDLARGMNGEEKLLRNLRDECASEAMEIAMYLTIEQYAREVEDHATERLAASIRADEERMLERLFAQVPRLTADAVAADVRGSSQYSMLRTGAVDGVRSVAASAARSVSRTASRAARRSSPVGGSSAKGSRPAVRKPAASSSLTRSPATSAGGATKRAASKPRASATSKSRSSAASKSRSATASKARSTSASKRASTKRRGVSA